MCGIAGILAADPSAVPDREILTAMTRSLVHRGPDGSGYHVEPGIGLGHRRLSIIDLAGGAQPMATSDGVVVVSYNGEIYNFRELAKDLASRGARFHTNCDTEVILQAWRAWGPSCVEHFRGMFAFALWDADRRCLFLARDRLGIKPLYYCRLRDGSLAFASELKALLVRPDLNPRLDEAAVEEYFALGYVPDPKTIYRDIRKLPPGHRMLVDCDGKGRIDQYWDVDFTKPLADSDSAIEEGLIARLQDAVKARLIADVPLGAFLSGGVDSSAVVAMMAGVADRKVTTCSIGFDREDFDETAYARAVVERYGTNHFTRRVDPDDFDLIDRLAGAYDEPFADSSAIPTFRLCEVARQRVTVALSGDGGDETFAGYRRYGWFMSDHRRRRFVPPGLRFLLPLVEGGGRRRPHGPIRKTLASLLKCDLEAYLEMIAISPTRLRRQMFSTEMHRRLDGHGAVDALSPFFENAKADDPLSRIQYLDFKTYLPGDILTKVDRASMAHSLEVRVPILDHQFLDWAVRIPASKRMKAGQGKRIFKRALEAYLPSDILYRDKMGFGVPISQWFQGPLKDRLDRVIASERLLDTGLFDQRTLQRLRDEHIGGARDHGGIAWALMMFEASLRHVDTL